MEEEEERQEEGTEAVQEPEFTREQLIGAERYAGYVDLIGAILREDQTYLITEVDRLIQQYLRKEVK